MSLALVTQADADAGNIHNVCTADSDETGPVDDPEDVPVPQSPTLTLVKTATPLLMTVWAIPSAAASCSLTPATSL